jgi:hypothetical protein
MAKKVIVKEIDCVGIELNKFEMIPSKKNTKSRSRVYIIFDDKMLGYFKVYEDGDVEFIKQ